MEDPEMKQFVLAILTAALATAAVTAEAGETGSAPAVSAAVAPAEAGGDATTWLLLAEVSVSGGDVRALPSCLDQDRVASVVNTFARKLEAVAMPEEASQPWLSCGEAGCP